MAELVMGASGFLEDPNAPVAGCLACGDCDCRPSHSEIEALLSRLHTLEGDLGEVHEVLGTMKDGPWPIPRLMVRLVRLHEIARRALQGSEGAG